VIAALNREIHAPDSRFVEQALRDMVTSLRHASRSASRCRSCCS
jgi:hypothetical protein